MMTSHRSLNFTLLISFRYLRYYENIRHKNTSQSKVLIVPGLASRKIVHLKKLSCVGSVSTFIFFILYVKPIRSLLIDPTYTSRIIVPVAYLNILYLILKSFQHFSTLLIPTFLPFSKDRQQD